MFDRTTTGPRRSRFLPIPGLAGGIFLCLVLAAAPGRGQDGADSRRGANDSPANNTEFEPIPVPPALIAGLLADTPEGRAALVAFVAKGGGAPEQILRRARSVVRALDGARPIADPVAIMAAANNVASIATAGFGALRIMRLAVDSSYRPARRTIAFDFGPPDAVMAPGFDRILPTDPRLSGTSMQAIRRPGRGALSTDGMIGLERIVLRVPDGPKRLLLTTEALGEPGVNAAPFGEVILVNGQATRIAPDRPEAWLNHAFLTRRAAQLVADSAEATDRLDRLVAGATIGDLTVADTGGVVTIETVVEGGTLTIEFKVPPGGRQRTYLTGMLIEPGDEESSLVRTLQAKNNIVSREDRLVYEAQVAVAIAALLEALAPAAGLEARLDLLDLPEPILELPLAASPS